MKTVIKKVLQVLAIVAGSALILYGCEKEPKTIPVTGVSLNPTTLTLTEGDTQTLTATVIPENASKKDVVWSSSDTGVATVEAGLVTAVAPGSATITVKTEDGAKTATCAVTVNAKVYPVTGISVDPASKEVEVGEKFTITATVAPDNATNKQIVWTSDKEDVATVSDGEVTAVAAGTATITAKTVDGEFTATCEVTVKITKTTMDAPVLGWFLNKDGSITEAKQTEGENLSYAVVAYVGSVDHYFSHFIAIALNDCTADGSDGQASMAYADGMKAIGLFAEKHAITYNGTTYNTNTSGENSYDVVAIGKTVSSATRTADAEIGWRMPSVTDWRYIFEGLTAGNEEGARASATDPVGVQNMTSNNIANNEGTILKNAINNACGNDGVTAFYWVNSDHSGKPVNSWNYRFDMSIWGLLGKTNTAPHVRAVFAY